MADTAVTNQIHRAIEALSKRPEFLAWLKEEKISEGLILVNNSFIFRQKIKTNKSAYYLAIRKWTARSGRLLSGGNSILRNFLPTVNTFLVFAIENRFERPQILVTHNAAVVFLRRPHGLRSR